MLSIINECIITKSNAKVLKNYVDSKSDPLYKVYRGFHSGVDISAKSVYSLCPGLVVHCGVGDTDTTTVIVRYNASKYILYSNFKSTAVSINTSVDSGTLLGTVDKYVHVEYLTPVTSMWPVRVLSSTYYKHDPTQILESNGEGLFSYADSLYGSNASPVVADSSTYVTSVINPFDDGGEYFEL